MKLSSPRRRRIWRAITSRPPTRKSRRERYAALAKDGLISKDQNSTYQTTFNSQNEALRADEAAINSAKASLNVDKAALETAKLNLVVLLHHARPSTGAPAAFSCRPAIWSRPTTQRRWSISIRSARLCHFQRAGAAARRNSQLQQGASARRHRHHFSRAKRHGRAHVHR